MTRAKDTSPTRRVPLGPALVALVALLLCLPAWRTTQRAWHELPEQKIIALDRGAMQDVFDRRNRMMPQRARDAFLLRLGSNALTDTFRGEETTGDALSTIEQCARAVRDSDLGRVQIIAARIRLLEQAGEPPNAWWAELQTEIEDLHGKQFKHHQAALVEHWAACYETLGIGAGSSHTLAVDLVGHAHGPLLQFITTHFEQLIADRVAAGDEPGAETCRTALLELLRQCVLETDAPGVQLLAGDLLARVLPADSAALAEQLRDWRIACQQAYQSRPVAAIDPHRWPAVAPATYHSLMFRLGLTGWLATATLAAAVTALAALIATLIQRPAGESGRYAFVYGVGAAVLVALLGAGWTALFPGRLAEDLRAGINFAQATPRLALIAAAVALAALLCGAFLAALRAATKTSFALTLARLAPATWLLLVVMLLVCAALAGVGTRHYEEATAAAYADGGIITQVPQTKPLLSALHDWEP